MFRRIMGPVSWLFLFTPVALVVTVLVLLSHDPKPPASNITPVASADDHCSNYEQQVGPYWALENLKTHEFSKLIGTVGVFRSDDPYVWCVSLDSGASTYGFEKEMVLEIGWHDLATGETFYVGNDGPIDYTDAGVYKVYASIVTVLPEDVCLAVRARVNWEDQDRQREFVVEETCPR